MDEELVWEASPSQAVNAGTYILCALFCWLIIPLIWGLWRWLEVRSTRYQLSTERLRMVSGVFSRRFEEVELYRIRDTAYAEPFWLRLFGAGNIELRSSDASTPFLVLWAVPDGEAVRQQIRRQVETARRRQRIRSLEVAEMDYGYPEP